MTNNKKDEAIGTFRILGHSTKRKWAVYIVVAKPVNNSGKYLLYIGKVGDNREGCNPVISRVGNHFSFNKIHSQIRNKVPQKKTEAYNYDYHYAHFNSYTEKKNTINREKTNELERRLNKLAQERIKNSKHYKVLNAYKGDHVKKKSQEERDKLLSKNDNELLKKLIQQAIPSKTL